MANTFVESPGSIRPMSLIQRLKLYRFKPNVAGTVATLVLLPLLLNLGFWQLRRADDKHALIAQYDSGASTTQQLGADNVATLSLLQNVVVYGRYDASKQILLDNMPSSKNAANRTRPGYHVLTPLMLNERDIVLVNRGWVPLGQSREILPNIEISNAALNSDISVRGRIAELPRAGMHMPTTTATTWPRVLNFPTLAELRALYGDGLMPRIVLLDANEPNGFERDWSTRYSVGEFGPEKHIGYAVQWFGLAATLFIIYLVTGLRRRS
jgi:surfeit locus 1 family protein